ncbi:protein of unknown function [Petrocella atlantisensis]|uniref:Uncharacterized protein n=1 Tax=Petrocella atlantisensis TaxID=2173034 RepID=A0A3P7PAS0_9FIRM|nr:protein of unknown function [Petrocella atlantisensis]
MMSPIIRTVTHDKIITLNKCKHKKLISTYVYFSQDLVINLYKRS